MVMKVVLCCECKDMSNKYVVQNVHYLDTYHTASNSIWQVMKIHLQWVSEISNEYNVNKTILHATQLPVWL